MKKVLHITTSNTGGAGMVPHLIHREFIDRGHFSRILVHGKSIREDEFVIPYYSAFQIEWQRAYAYVQRRLPGNDPGQGKYFFLNTNEGRNHVPANQILKTIGFVPDIIIVYWVSGFVNTETIRDLYHQTGAKITWVATDMAPYTGGCHYSWKCEGYLQSCEVCPSIEGSRLPANRAARNLAKKQAALQGIPLRVVASYGQSFEMATKSALFQDKQIFPHYLPVNRESVAGVGQGEARKQLGLPADKTLLLYGATRLDDPRKGARLLQKALVKLAASMTADMRDQYRLVIAGGAEEEDSYDFGFEVLTLGTLDFAKELPLAFIATDGYISASLQDTGPYMVNLAIGYGCPVVSFYIGVAQALVRNGETGFCAATQSAEGLATAIQRLLELDPGQRKRMQKACEEVARKYLQWDDAVLEKFGLGTEISLSGK